MVRQANLEFKSPTHESPTGVLNGQRKIRHPKLWQLVSALVTNNSQGLPFFPNPLETEIAHVHREPLGEAAGNFNIQAF